MSSKAKALPSVRIATRALSFTFTLELDQQALAMLAHLSGYEVGGLITKHITREFTAEQWNALFGSLRGTLEQLRKRNEDAEWFWHNGTLVGRPGYWHEEPLGRGVRTGAPPPDPASVEAYPDHLLAGGKLHVLTPEPDMSLSTVEVDVCVPRDYGNEQIVKQCNTWYPGCAEREWRLVGSHEALQCQHNPARLHFRLRLVETE